TASPNTAKESQMPSPIHMAARNGNTSRKPLEMTRATSAATEGPGEPAATKSAAAKIRSEVNVMTTVFLYGGRYVSYRGDLDGLGKPGSCAGREQAAADNKGCTRQCRPADLFLEEHQSQDHRPDESRILGRDEVLGFGAGVGPAHQEVPAQCQSRYSGHGQPLILRQRDAQPWGSKAQRDADDEILEEHDFERFGHQRLPPRQDEIVGVENRRGDDGRHSYAGVGAVVGTAELAKHDDDHPDQAGK